MKTQHDYPSIDSITTYYGSYKLISLPILSALFVLLFVATGHSYPSFIGYKYASCLTCHYNGLGNGPLNDYGRAVWAAEIAAKGFSSASDDELAQSSGFLGSAKLPWWIRPGIKAREIFYQTDPGKGTWEDILMQAEGSLAIFFDKKQKFGLIGSFGYVPLPRRYTNSGSGVPASADVGTQISREHYLRWQATRSLWVYAGLMDKVYGIRIVNHTAYSRSKVGVAQNDQSHGVILQYIRPKWELAVNGFAGNMFQEQKYRQKGASTLIEYQLKEAWRIGATALMSNNDYVAQNRYGLLTRYGFGSGSALLFEGGVLQDAISQGKTKTGYYVYSEVMQKLFRGYNLFFTGQAWRDEFESNRPDNIKTGAGFLMFPMQRLEFRAEVENTRQTINSANVPVESWALMGQVHVSL